MKESLYGMSGAFDAWRKNQAQKEVRGALRNVGIEKKDFKHGEKHKFKKLKKKLRKKFLEKQILLETDRLTGLLNLTGLENVRKVLKKESKSLRKERRDQKRSEEYVIFEMDVNNLKVVNNTLGHAEGNKYLKKIASVLTTQILTNETRKRDLLIFRWGGDEITVFLNTNLEGAENWWKRVNPQLEENGLSISAGATLFDREKPKKSAKRADALLYKAKEMSHESKKNILLLG